jgi:hypothetical protein
VFATTRIPLVLHAPGAWLPAPLDDASYSRKERPVFTTFRYYFLAPEGSKDPQIYFEGSGRLFEPGGKPFQQGKPLPGWVRLPADRPGLWAFEGVVNKRVQVKNLPPFFAVGDPESYFLPDVPWAPQEALGPAKRAGEDGQGEQ